MKKIDDILSQDKKEQPNKKERRKENIAKQAKQKVSPAFKKDNDLKGNGLKRKKRFKWSIIRHWILLALIFLLPLWFLPWGVDKVGLAKQVLLTFLAGSGILIWFYESLNKGKLIYAKSIVNFGVLILLVTVGAGTFLSIHPQTSLYTSTANSLNLLNFILLTFFYLLVITTKKSKLKISLVDTFLASISLVSIYTLLQIFEIHIFSGFTKNLGFNMVGTINSIGILAGLAFLLGLNRFLESSYGKLKSKGLKIFLACTTIINFIYLLIINFQVVWYGITLGSLFLIALKVVKERRKRQKVRQYTLPIALMIISLIMSFSGQLQSLGLWQPQLNVKGIPTDVSLNFKTSLNIASKTLHNADFPKLQDNNNLDATSTFSETIDEKDKLPIKRLLFGSGLANYDKMWLKYRGTALNRSSLWQAKFSQAGSSFLTWLTETGYAGMLSMVLLMILILVQVFRLLAGSNYSSQSVGMFVGIIFLGLMWFLYPFNLTLYFAFFLLIGFLVRETTIVNGTEDNKETYQAVDFNEPIQKALIFTISLIIVMVGIVFLMYFEVQRYVASAQTAKGLETIQIDTKDQEDEEIIQKATQKINEKINLLAKAYNLDRSNDLAVRQISQLYLQKLNLILQQENAATQDLTSLAQNAIQAAQEAVRIDNTDVANWNNLAQVYENLVLVVGDSFKLAIQNYNKALEFDPSSPTLYIGKGRTYFTEAKRAGSQITQIQQAVQKGQVKSKEEAQKTLQQLQKDQEKLLANSIKELKKAAELKPNHSLPYLLLSQIYEAQGKIKEAIENTSNLVILNQDNAGLWFQLGLLHYKDDALDKAEASFSQAISLLDGKYANARYFLGLTYAQQGETQKALKEFETIIKDNPDNQEIQTIVDNLKQGKPVLEGVTPPAQAPENREEAPVMQTEQ